MDRVRESSGAREMKHITKPVNPVDFNSGQRRDLAEIIKGLRNDIIVDRNSDGGASEPDAESELPDNARVEKKAPLHERPSRAERFRMGLLGITTRVPA